jgi:2-C-methyl-D-erythritol 4-phosphate cytidylyltransferase
MPKSNKYWVVMPAAGIGERMGSDIPKQYVSVCGKTIIEHTIDCFIDRNDIESIFVSISKSDRYWSTLPISKSEKIVTVIGGDERYESVYNGLCNLKDKAADNDWVLVHDAVRPCLTQSIIDRFITDLNCHDVGGILALPCFETMKKANKENEIEETIDRKFIWRAQTPQMFKYKKLLSAIERTINKNIVVTDEAMAMELSNYKPMLIQGDRDNIKITHKTDLKHLELFLGQVT